MKKTESVAYLGVTLLLLLSVTLFFICVPQPEAEEAYFTADAVLPSSLQTISDEAFWGTGFQAVFLNEDVTYVGNEAFANNVNLIDVFIPQSVAYIGSDAFPLRAVIHGVVNSYAQTWADNNEHTFIADDRWNTNLVQHDSFAKLMMILTCMIVVADDRRLIQVWRYLRASRRSMRPQDRPELYPIDYRFP